MGGNTPIRCPADSFLQCRPHPGRRNTRKVSALLPQAGWLQQGAVEAALLHPREPACGQSHRQSRVPWTRGREEGGDDGDMGGLTPG